MNVRKPWDKRTQEYFDSYTPEYHSERYQHLLSFVQRTSSSQSSFMDLGCGGGNVISCFKKKTKITRFAGVDISTKLIERAKKATGSQIFKASVSDDNLHLAVDQRYDYVMLGQVLHHLVGKTRNKSKGNARRTLLNAWSLLNPGGFLLVCEPIYSPSVAGDLIFWIKKGITCFTAGRLELGGDKYHNLGAPVVSFLTDRELYKMIDGLPFAKILSWYSEPKPLSFIKRLACIRSCQMLSCIVEKGNIT